MGAQDNTERVLRSLYVMISKSEIYEFDEDKIVIDRDRITNLLSDLKECIYDMMDEYEMTKESRDQAEREFRKQADEIVLDASHKAEDVYAASVMYTDEALGNVQRIMAEAEESVKTVYEEMEKRLQAERHTVQSNQTDLQSQLQDLTDTDKYVKLINERNREIRKEKEKEQRLAMRQRPESRYADRQTEIRVDQEAIRRLGLASESEEDEEAADTSSAPTEEHTGASEDAEIYADRQTEVRVDQEVLRKLGLAEQSQESEAQQARTEQKPQTRAKQTRVRQQAEAEQKAQARAQQQAEAEQKRARQQAEAEQKRARQQAEAEQKRARQQAKVDRNSRTQEQQPDAEQAVAKEWDEAILREQMMERARELEREKAKTNQRQRSSRHREETDEISLMDLNPFSEEDPDAQEIEDELIRLDLDEDYFKWKEEQDAKFDANVAKAKSKRRSRKS